MSIYYDHITDIEYLFIFMPYKCLRIQMSFLHSAMGIFCDCSMSWSYSLDFVSAHKNSPEGSFFEKTIII